MVFLNQIFTFTEYYLMVKYFFNIHGYNDFKGLNNKLPPIRYLGKDYLNNDLVTLAYPNDFIKFQYKLKKILENLKNMNFSKNKIFLDNKKNEIYEIYPSINELLTIPNGFIALFTTYDNCNILLNEFNKNTEIYKLEFIKLDENGILINNFHMTDLLNKFVKKFNNNKYLVKKFCNSYLILGKINDINFNKNIFKPINKLNLFGGKRLYNETTIDSAYREFIEEFGLSNESKLLKYIKYNLYYLNKDIIKFNTFNIYLINLFQKI